MDEAQRRNVCCERDMVVIDHPFHSDMQWDRYLCLVCGRLADCAGPYDVHVNIEPGSPLEASVEARRAAWRETDEWETLVTPYSVIKIGKMVEGVEQWDDLVALKDDHEIALGIRMMKGEFTPNYLNGTEHLRLVNPRGGILAEKAGVARNTVVQTTITEGV